MYIYIYIYLYVCIHFTCIVMHIIYIYIICTKQSYIVVVKMYIAFDNTLEVHDHRKNPLWDDSSSKMAHHFRSLQVIHPDL